MTRSFKTVIPYVESPPKQAFMPDNRNLERFLTVQQDKFESALRELESGRKRTHWMWFIFPQAYGLALSGTAREYSIKSLNEARDYLNHPILGLRLRKCTNVLLDLEGISASDIFSYPDDLKLRSSMTLFSLVAGGDSVFQAVLNKYFRGKRDEKTVEIFDQPDFKGRPINILPEISDSLAFRVFAERKTKDRKDTCGDSFAVSYFDDKQLLLLAIADGVSSSPCDWKGSEVACEALVERFKSADGSIAQRMVNAASKAHNAVRQLDGRCAGSCTSLTFVVWPVMSDEVYVLNIGDSRAYLGPDNALDQITADDVQPQILKRNGEVVLQAGVPVFMRKVTRSLGQIEALEFSVQTHPFRSNYLLLLVSDGISKNEAFTSQIPGIFGSPNVEQELSLLVADSSPRNNDDATLIAVWRKPSTSEDAEQRYADCVENKTDFRIAGLSQIQVLDFLQEDLLNQIQNDNNAMVSATLDYADQYGIRFHRDFLGGFLSLVIRQGSDKNLVTRLRDLIRRAH